MVTLARFSVGRILLHLLAMAGDRCVRFHVEGIIRELPWIAAGPTLLTRMLTRVIGELVLYLRTRKFDRPGDYPILPVPLRIDHTATADHRNLTPGDFERASLFEVVDPINNVR
jgi:hypothetical protein